MIYSYRNNCLTTAYCNNNFIFRLMDGGLQEIQTETGTFQRMLKQIQIVKMLLKVSWCGLQCAIEQVEYRQMIEKQSNAPFQIA